MEGDGLGLDFALLYVHLVPGEDYRDVLANSDEVACYGTSVWRVADGSLAEMED